MKLDSINKAVDPTDISEVEQQLNIFKQVYATSATDSADFIQATQQDNELTYSNVPFRLFLLIAYNLDHEITVHDTAKLIVAGARHEDLSTVLPLDPETKVAIRFQEARVKSGLTEKEIAAKSVELDEYKLIKAEYARIPLSISTWAELFKIIGTKITIDLF